METLRVIFVGGRMDGQKRAVAIHYPIIYINEPAITAVKNDPEMYELKKGSDMHDYYCYIGGLK